MEVFRDPAIRKDFRDTLLYLVPICAVFAYLKVIMHGRAYEFQGFSEKERRLLYTQEAVRQGINQALWLVTFCTSHKVLEKLLPKWKGVKLLVASCVLSSIPDTFLRPKMTAWLSKKILDRPNNLSADINPVKRTHFSSPAVNTVMPKPAMQAGQIPVAAFGNYYPRTAFYNPLGGLYR